MKTCCVDGCDNTAGTGRGMCHKHYARWRKNGDPLKVKRISGPMPLEERFSLQWKENEGTGCWEWIGSIGERGYGRIKVNRKTTSAHRVSYEMHKGQIPEGLYVCHHCDNPKCVNPDHLFVGTARDNRLDCIRKGRINMRRFTEMRAA